MNVKTEICKAFNAQAAKYERAAIAQHEIGERLFERLHYLKIQPRYVLDLGCGPGVFSGRLKKHYPKAQIIGLDLAFDMLKEAKNKQSWRSKWALTNGDMSAMPFPTGLFDLVFANQVIHWSSSLSQLMCEINRVMNAEGCLMFSTLGPDTFQELRNAWAKIDGYAHVNHYMDMHDVGDCLLAEHFLDPVVDMEILTINYPNLSKLLHALKDQGVRNINALRNAGLTGKQAWRNFEQAMVASCTEQGKFPLTYEVVYGHAWKGEQQRTDKGMEIRIPVTSLRKK